MLKMLKMLKPHNQNNNQTNYAFTLIESRQRRTNLCTNPAGAGFTLIELLVVISIISLLSTVIFAVFSTSRVQAQDAKKKEEVHQVNNALELYRSTYGAYPNNYTCTAANSCTVGRTGPAIQGDTVSDGDWAYKKSMQELVTNGVLATIPEADSGAGYAYYNDTGSGEAVFFTGLNGGYGNTTVGQTFPSTAQFYAGDVAEELWPTKIRITLQSVNGVSCGSLSQEMTYIVGSKPPKYQRSGDIVFLISNNTRTTVSGNITWNVYLRNLATGPCQGTYTLLRATTADNPMGYFYGINGGVPDSNLSVATVESAD